MHQGDPFTADPHTVATFRALVEVIVPDTPELAESGEEQIDGAVKLKIHEYLIRELDHILALMSGISLTVYPLSASTAMLLDAGAVQYIASRQSQMTLDRSAEEGGLFYALSPSDRIGTLAMLEKLNVDLGSLPSPYQNDGGLVKFMVDYLNRAAMFGHYSEWSSYGTTRTATPAERVEEGFPAGWKQAGYPGVSQGYRALRGFLATIQHKGRRSSDG